MKQAITTYKFLLLPTSHQKTIILKSIDAARFLYNRLLQTRKCAWESYGVPFSKYDMQGLIPSLKQQYPFLKDNLNSQVAQDVNNRLDTAYQKFFAGGGYPNWAKKRIYNSITYPQYCELKNGLLKLPQLGLIKFKDTRGLDDTIKIRQCNVSYDYTNEKFFVCITINRFFEELPHTEKTIGIDMGVAQFCTCSDGKPYEHKAYYTKCLKKLRVKQRQLSRQKKYGENWKKTKRQISVLHKKVANQRVDYLHKISTELINNNQVIVREDLKVKNMTSSAKGTIESPGNNIRQKSGLNRSMLDCGIGLFFIMLDYKAVRAGRTIEKVNPAYTSQTCSECGAVDKVSRKSQSKFACTQCGHAENADINAAKNIWKRASSIGDNVIHQNVRSLRFTHQNLVV
jgi:putative transposase